MFIFSICSLISFHLILLKSLFVESSSAARILSRHESFSHVAGVTRRESRGGSHAARVTWREFVSRGVGWDMLLGGDPRSRAVSGREAVTVLSGRGTGKIGGFVSRRTADLNIWTRPILVGKGWPHGGNLSVVEWTRDLQFTVVPSLSVVMVFGGWRWLSPNYNFIPCFAGAFSWNVLFGGGRVD